MKSEDAVFAERFESYELWDYVVSRRYYEELKEEYNDEVESLYDGCSPTITGYDYDEGRLYSLSTRTEDMAILIIETKGRYEKKMKRALKKAELFEVAMESLTPRERDVIRIAYQGANNDLGLTLSYFKQVLLEAEDKLCSFISCKRSEMNKEFHEQWKRQRVCYKAS